MLYTQGSERLMHRMIQDKRSALDGLRTHPRAWGQWASRLGSDSKACLSWDGGEGKIGNATDETSTLTPSVVPKSKEVIPSLTEQEL